MKDCGQGGTTLPPDKRTTIIPYYSMIDQNRGYLCLRGAIRRFSPDYLSGVAPHLIVELILRGSNPLV
jgi:hypothetical protein